MGVYSLARQEDVTIRSQPEPADDTGPIPQGWRVRLARAHFLGEEVAAVEPMDPTPPGTEVSFGNAGASASDVQNAARHFPLPVFLRPPAGCCSWRVDHRCGWARTRAASRRNARACGACGWRQDRTRSTVRHTAERKRTGQVTPEHNTRKPAGRPQEAGDAGCGTPRKQRGFRPRAARLHHLRRPRGT